MHRFKVVPSAILLFYLDLLVHVLNKGVVYEAMDTDNINSKSMSSLKFLGSLGNGYECMDLPKLFVVLGFSSSFLLFIYNCLGRVSSFPLTSSTIFLYRFVARDTHLMHPGGEVLWVISTGTYFSTCHLMIE
ncbi:hypothetical protein GQX74_004952 [Glossina fuscipes]|nr:hypothetical protein GQX74_004952 [Glossina fuscipes]